MDIALGVLQIVVGVVAISYAVASLSSPKILLKDWMAEKIEACMRRPHDYLLLRRTAHILLGTGFVLFGVRDLIALFEVQLILRILGWILLTAAGVTALYGNRVYLDRWSAPRSKPPKNRM